MVARLRVACLVGIAVAVLLLALNVVKVNQSIALFYPEPRTQEEKSSKTNVGGPIKPINETTESNAARDLLAEKNSRDTTPRREKNRELKEGAVGRLVGTRRKSERRRTDGDLVVPLDLHDFARMRQELRRASGPGSDEPSRSEIRKRLLEKLERHDGGFRSRRRRGRRRGPGYNRSGGELPEDDLQLYPDPRTWPSIDNGTCLGGGASTTRHRAATTTTTTTTTTTRSPPLFEWQTRAPYAILLGTMKGGTIALVNYLWDHPLFPKERLGRHEMRFYSTRLFRRDENGIPREANQRSYAQLFRERYPEVTMTTRSGAAGNDNNQTVRYYYAIDDTPRYLLWSDRIPSAILCVTPWVKLLAILRNPVERAISHFKYEDEERIRKGYPMVDWEAWVEDDLRLLRDAGVVRDWTEVDFDAFAGSQEETLAWKKYLRSPNSKGILGRGLYAIQLEHYYDALDRAGKPRSDLMVIQSEELRSNTQAVYDRVTDFLAVPRHKLTDTREKHVTGKTFAPPLPDHLRKTMEEFFLPYNRRLYKLLKWTSVWESPSGTSVLL